MRRSITGSAYGKLNLALDVTGRRKDGYHLVRMVMQTVNIYDTVTVTRTADNDITTTSDSNSIPSGRNNLVWRAAEVMRREYGLNDGLHIHIQKRIPVAAGMAGGSADAAAVFRLLRELYSLDIRDEELERLALPLGADIPYCIVGGTQLCEGIGEVMTPLPAPPLCTLLVVKPDIDVSTQWVYQAFDRIPEEQVRHPDIEGILQAIREGDLRRMSRCCSNVLEQQTAGVYPVIRELERFFLERGALGSIMTGSGPTVFAVYEDAGRAQEVLAELEEETACRRFMKFRAAFI